MTKIFYRKRGLTHETNCVAKEIDRRTRDTRSRICPIARRLLEHKRMGKSHLFEWQLDSRNSRRYAKLGNNPLDPVCQLQKARLELVDLCVKSLNKLQATRTKKNIAQ